MSLLDVSMVLIQPGKPEPFDFTQDMSFDFAQGKKWGKRLISKLGKKIEYFRYMTSPVHELVMDGNGPWIADG